MPIKSLSNSQNVVNPVESARIAHYGGLRADITIVCYGSVAEQAQQAIEFLAIDNIHTNILHILSLQPFPTLELASIFRASHHLLLIENDPHINLQQIIFKQTSIKVIHRMTSKSTSKAVTPADMIAHINKVFTYKIS